MFNEIMCNGTVIPSNKIPLTPFTKGGIMKNGRARVKLIGVGGGGGNAINHIAQLNKKRPRFIVVNTDRKALNDLNVEEKIQIGKCLTSRPLKSQIRGDYKAIK